MATTIIDVAKEANVSPSTVSRVIANNPRISERTKQKVREVMDRLDYHPNFQARNLAAKSTKTIGVIMASSSVLAFQNPFFPEVLRGICSAAHASKYGMYLSTGETEEEIFDEVVSMTQGRRVDGIILLYSKVKDRTMDYLQSIDFPFVVVGRPFENEASVTYVDNDNTAIAAEVVDYLLSLGHQDIAFVGGDINYVVSRDRLAGYQQALETAGIPFQQAYYLQDSTVNEDGASAIDALFHLPNRPTALIAHDDLTAYEIISILERKEINVPTDISIISFNNHVLSQHLRPPLTSVDIQIYDLGLEATECLLNKMDDPKLPATHRIIGAKIITRESCARRGID
ncbi:LacI family DNA-binding transcriptional regulator [Paenisporosarcina cavernae]|uniref:LacI family transcriptional regulator n=1 Tax=Paenisporosarcina cavernae TaxID=2320858 RepID=A0A385YRG1_9BACL|nr:LacI family DNA-binding transcriptional regulator [Paenisporosarcina cavernae]AYC28587.1 LacI family transcriptional regulator [Paenisporosarcina cavernae]